MAGKPGFRTTFISFVAVALASGVAGPRVSCAADGAHLAGKWSLNQDQSDDANKKIQDARASARLQSNRYPDDGVSPSGTDYPGAGPGAGTGGIGSPAGRGGMGRMGRGQGGPMAEGPGLSDADVEQLAETPKALTVDQDDKQVTVTDDSGQVKNLYPDGKKHKEKDSSGQSNTVKTHWDGNRLVAESKLHSGKLTETYDLSGDGKRLTFTQQLDSSQLGQPLIIRRVYDSAASNDATHP
jgi:hypothetical protein